MEELEIIELGNLNDFFKALPIWSIESETGYKPITTFYDDFSIADIFGGAAIFETYQRAVSEWADNYKFLSELYLVLNHKGWYWYDCDTHRAGLYFDLQEHLYSFFNEKYRDDKEAQAYFFEVTD